MRLLINITKKTIINTMVSVLIIPVFAYMLSYTILNNYSLTSLDPQTISFSISVSESINLQIFYSETADGVLDFREDYSITHQLSKSQKPQKVELKLPYYVNLNKIRIDFGDNPGIKAAISKIEIIDDDFTHHIHISRLGRLFTRANDIINTSINRNMIVFETSGFDPFVIIDNLKQKIKINPIIPKEINHISWLASIIFALITFVTLTVFTNRSSTKISFHKLLFCIIFVFILLLPLWGFRYSIDKDWKAEKRRLAEKPEFIYERLFDYPGQFNRYFNDHYGYRKWLTYCYNYICYKYFYQSPLPNNIFLGDDNWMFYISVPELFLERQFTEQQLLTIKNNIERREKWCKERGIDFYLSITPEKMKIYPEHFPHYDTLKHDIIKLQQLKRYLEQNSHFRIIDPSDLLKEKKSQNQLYYKWDTHWNDIGAFWGYHKIINRIREKHTNIPIYKFEDFDIVEKDIDKANIAVMIGVDSYYGKGLFLEPKKPYNANLMTRYKHRDDEYSEVVIYSTNNNKLPRLMMFRDSFGEFMFKYLSESFSQSTYVFTNYIDESMILKDKPDIVIYQLSEGRINLLLRY